MKPGSTRDSHRTRSSASCPQGSYSIGFGPHGVENALVLVANGKNWGVLCKSGLEATLVKLEDVPLGQLDYSLWMAASLPINTRPGTLSSLLSKTCTLEASESVTPETFIWG